MYLLTGFIQNMMKIKWICSWIHGHLFRDAFLAISDRSSGVSFSALALTTCKPTAPPRFNGGFFLFVYFWFRFNLANTFIYDALSKLI